MSRTIVSICCAVWFAAAVELPADAQIRSPFLQTTMNFKNVTDQTIMPTVAESGENEKEVELGDIDNDGDTDVVMAVAFSDFGSRRNKMYINDGGVFTEVSGTSMIPDFTTSDVSRNAKLRDFNNDGWLDLIIVNDSNSGGAAGRTRYFANQHPNGQFSHFADETFRLNGAAGASCSAVVDDFDNNGSPDLYLGNYPFSSQDTYYLNSGGTFSNVTSTHVPNEFDYTVDVSSADINGDGKIDLLVSSHFDPNYIIYNDNDGAGDDGLGDFKYSGSRQNLGTVALETAMEPADFNGDGQMDIYFSNHSGTIDRILQNEGNVDHKATFTEITMPGSVSQTESRKATVSDLNNDDRVDLIVMGEDRRPHILRNTSVNGETSFVDWTPASVFPDDTHAGWHAATLDVNGDGLNDILIGGTRNDFLFENAPPVAFKESQLGGALPALHNLDPVAVVGGALAGETDVYAAGDIPAGSDVSIVLSSKADIALEIRDALGALVVSSDRGGNAIEEALQFTAPGGALSVGVLMLGGPPRQTQYTLEVLSRDCHNCLSPAAVPEPSAVCLVALALAGWAVRRRPAQRA